MKPDSRLILALLGLAGAVFVSTSRAADIVLPASAALPPGSGIETGFKIRTVQGPNNVAPEQPLANSFIRAVRQLNGTLVDADGNAVVNEAVAGPFPDGSFYSPTVSFELLGQPVLGTLATQPFPGIPGSGGHTKSFAVEAVGFIELLAGTYTLGISVGADRTDVNDDDGFVLFTGQNPRSFFAQPIGSFQRTVPFPFTGNQQNTNFFSVEAPVDGVYPFRITYWQTDRGANLNLFQVNDFTGEFILVGDLNRPFDALQVYNSVHNGERANAPYVAEVSPLPGSAGLASTVPIQLALSDGETAINDSSVKLYLNSVLVTPQSVARDGRLLRLRYDPSASRTTVANLVRVEFADTAGFKQTNNWDFTISLQQGASPQVTGQWEFDSGDLRAAVGKSLQYLDPAFDGPTGSAAEKTQFGTTTSFGIPDINGVPADVMRVPGTLSRQIGYVMAHGISPNGGGQRVNQYTITYDIYVDTGGPGAASLLQISSTNNVEGDDGDLFWQGNNFGQGTDGYRGTGAFTAGAWHRVTAAYDEAANPPVVTKYVDGIKQDDWTANQGLDAARRALLPLAVLFGDGDHDERRVMYVNSIQVRSGKLSDGEMVVLGGPSASGIPLVLPKVSNLAGAWDFDRGDLSATVGKALQYLDPAFDGPAGSAPDRTQFGTTTSFGIPDIDGVPANVMRVPGTLSRQIGYVMAHGIAPNGGGQRVNQYTITYDIYVDPAGPGAASLLQISSTNNVEGDDGDLFWQGNNFGQGTDGYRGTGAFTAGAWHRVTAAYDEAANPPVVTKYVDGIKQDDWTANQGLDAARRALLPLAVLFGDGDHDERRVMYVNSIQIRAGKLSDGEMVALSGPSASGIPVAVPAVADVAGAWNFESGDLSATAGKALQYLDPSYDGPAGSAPDRTQFGTTTSFGIPDINGVPANVMRVPGTLTRQLGYVMAHGITPNGGGQKVNQYTLLFDIYVDPAGPGAASLLQISSTNNVEGDDGDLFWQGNNFGQGTDGYNGTGAFTAGAWHRVVAAYDEAANPPVVTKYVDGIKQDDWTANQGLDAARRALQPLAVLFGDGDHDERRVMYVKSIQIRSRKLRDAEIAGLGGPSASGVPVVVPASTVAGQWDFEFGNLNASVGKNLQYLDPAYDGPTGLAAEKTQFGTTTSFGIPDINGVPANVMRVPGTLTRQLGYVMAHGIAPNGGGQKVNQFTLLFDILVDTSGPGAASLLQVSSTNNVEGDDGDLFWQGNNFGQGTDGYRGTGAFTAGAWHRVAAAYNLAANPPVVVKYVDGIFQDNWTANQALDASRRALQPLAVLFGDGDHDERRTMFVNSIQICSTALSGANLAILGGPSASGIPVVVPTTLPAVITITRQGDQLLLSWPAGPYVLESSNDLGLGSAGWLPVFGVTGNSAAVFIDPTPTFYRLAPAVQ